MTNLDLAFDLLKDRVRKEKRVEQLNNQIQRLVRDFSPTEVDYWIEASNKVLQLKERKG